MSVPEPSEACEVALSGARRGWARTRRWQAAATETGKGRSIESGRISRGFCEGGGCGWWSDGHCGRGRGREAGDQSVAFRDGALGDRQACVGAPGAATGSWGKCTCYETKRTKY